MSKKPIGELLVEAGLIERSQLEEALAVQAKKGGKLVQILIALGFFEPRSFVSFLARQPGIASIDLSHYEVSRELVDLVPREFALKHEVFPIDRLGKLLTLGMVCPLDSATIKELEDHTGLRVKPILCSPEDIRDAITRYYPRDFQESPLADSALEAGAPLARLETSLKLGNVVTLVRRIEALPTLPETVDKVRATMTDPASAAEDVANVITTDPPIAAKVLSVANSAAYGFPNRIDNVRLAVALLGLRETFNIVLSAAIINRSDRYKGFNYRAFWANSMACASACKVVAEACGQGARTSVTTAGLLHDLGRIALIEVVPDLCGKLDASLDDEALLSQEESLIGIGHPEAGFELAQRWGLPEDIAQAIRFHHTPQYATESREVVAIVAVADVLYKIAERDGEFTTDMLNGHEARLGMLGLGKEDGVEILRICADKRLMDARNGRIW